MKCEKCNKTKYIQEYKGQNLCTLHRLELKKKDPEYLERIKRYKRESYRRKSGYKNCTDEYMAKLKANKVVLKQMEEVRGMEFLTKDEVEGIIKRLRSNLL